MQSVRRSYYWVVSCILAVVIVGCALLWQNTSLLHPLSCSQFVDARLTSASLNEVQQVSAEKWIDQAYYFNSKSKSSETQIIRWTWYSLFKEYKYTHFDGNAWFTQYWRYSSMTISDALRCLGKPDSYLSYSEFLIDVHRYTLCLIYEKQGLIVTVKYLYDKPVPLVNEQTPLFFVDILSPDTSSNLIQARFSQNLDELSNLIVSIYPWPDSIDRIQTPAIELRDIIIAMLQKGNMN